MYVGRQFTTDILRLTIGDLYRALKKKKKKKRGKKKKRKRGKKRKKRGEKKEEKKKKKRKEKKKLETHQTLLKTVQDFQNFRIEQPAAENEEST